jgi:hypothetical protein
VVAAKAMSRELKLLAASGHEIVESSLHHDGGATFFVVRGRQGTRRLGILGDVAGFEGSEDKASGTRFCPLTERNAAALRDLLPWLAPVPLGLRTSAGFGDRLGLATSGHVRALRRVCQAEKAIAPIFAQQSVRENARTGRTPQEVMDDATWGVFEEGWRLPWGADADHLKTPADVEDFAAAGFTFFTIDPGDHVDDEAHTASSGALEGKLQTLPWEILEDTLRDLEARYLDRALALETGTETMDREQLWRAAAKYGKAIAHTVTMYRHILGRLGEGRFELEVSVDETENPTSVAEHIYIAGELGRLGVRWVSLAPRFVGEFEKGVDYIGDIELFEKEFARHAAVAKRLGPYKLSLHSGSDKFSIYPITARLTTAAHADGEESLVHLKTAGTSFLEALRTIAAVDPPFFREILELARDHYEEDRATYHVSARLDKVPAQTQLADEELVGLLDDFNAREVLHVTFGSVLASHGDRLRECLRRNHRVYGNGLAAHFEKHLKPFVAEPNGGGARRG